MRLRGSRQWSGVSAPAARLRPPRGPREVVGHGGLAAGAGSTYTVTVRARDNAGNVSPTKTVSVNVIDTTPPDLRITTPPEGETFTLTERRDR